MPFIMRQPRKTSGSGGFSLVEVMVAVLVISIGLLGIAKMQALALSSTSNARLRALASLEAASLASAIRANRTYWAGSTTTAGTANDLVVTIQGPSITNSTDGTLQTAGVNCALGGGNAPCSTGLLAAYDVQQWASQLNALIPGVAATIDCDLPAADNPVTCTIQINWTENEVAANSTANGPAMSAPQYTLYVEP
jgi:type IV pilus assembly protein PilV